MAQRSCAAAGVLLFLCIAGIGWTSGRGERGGGAASPNACFDCHASTNPKYPLLGARQAYDTSGHKNLGNSSYANGDGCQRCHTNEGFVQFVVQGSVDPKSFVKSPSQPGCFTCHAPHEKGTMELRTVAPVTLANGQIFDVGRGNLCANCHHSPSIAAKTVAAMPANKVLPFWGAHHGPQADIVRGTNAFEFPNKKYGSSAHKDVINDGCVQCHMSLPDGRRGFTAEIGDHSFRIVGRVLGEEKVNVAGCVSCHKSIAQVPGTSVFNVIAEDDYDLDGSKDPVQEEVQGLLNKFVNKDGTGLLQKLNPPFYNLDGSFRQTKSDVERPVVQMAALYNYKMVLEDGSRGIHNPKYVIQILYDSLQALDPQFDVSRRPR